MLLSFSWLFLRKSCWFFRLTSSVLGLKIKPDDPDTVTRASEQPRALLDRLSSNGVKHVYVDGGATIQSFLSDDLVDEITLTVIPVLLGEGISLFGPLKKDVKLTLERTQAFDFGFVQTTYLLNTTKLSA